LKKALVFSLLILFLFNSIGYYFLFELNKYMARKEMKAAIQRNPAKMIILTIADAENDRDFCRIDKKEFRYKGEMYDIVRENKTGQKTVFTCLHDTKESRLFAGLKREAQNKSHFAMWYNLNMIVFSESAIDLNPQLMGDWRYPRIAISLKSSMLSTWCPPPEFS
jgi:hypothetical protein